MPDTFILGKWNLQDVWKAYKLEISWEIEILSNKAHAFYLMEMAAKLRKVVIIVLYFT